MSHVTFILLFLHTTDVHFSLVCSYSLVSHSLVSHDGARYCRSADDPRVVFFTSSHSRDIIASADFNSNNAECFQPNTVIIHIYLQFGI